MKGIRLLYLKNLRFLFFFACLIVAFSVNAQERKQLVILHTNDTHSTIIPVKETVADTLLAGRGGAVRRACLVDMERKKRVPTSSCSTVATFPRAHLIILCSRGLLR